MSLFFLFAIFLKLLFPVFQANEGAFDATYIVGCFSSTLIVTLIASYIKKPKLRKTFLFSVNIVLTFLIFSTLIYLRVFTDALSFEMLFIIDHLFDVRGSATALIGKRDAFFLLLDIPLAILLFWAPSKKSFVLKFDLETIKRNKIAKTLFISFSLWLLLIPLKGDTYADFFSKQGWSGIKRVNPLNYYIAELFTGLKRLIYTKVLTHEEKQEILTFVLNKAKDRESKPREFLFPKLENPNIIFIQVESLMAWAMIEKIKNEPITPFLNSLASRSIFIENFYSNSLHTCNSDFSTLTSLKPLQQTKAHIDFYLNDFVSLPKALKSLGYYSFYANPCRQHFWNVRGMNRSLGFDKGIYLDQLEAKEILGFGLCEKEFFGQILPHLSNLPKPFMAYLLTISSHHPFLFDNTPIFFPPESIPWEDKFTRGYVQLIKYTDKQIENFFYELDRNNLLENTVVIIFGDHPIRLAPFWDPLVEKLKGLPDYQEAAQVIYSKVPCIIYSKKFSPKIVKKYSSQIDLAPTVLEICGIKLPPEFLGEPVNFSGPGEVVHKSFSLISENNVSWGKGKNDFLYNLNLQTGTEQTSKFQNSFKLAVTSEKMVYNNLCRLKFLENKQAIGQ